MSTTLLPIRRALLSVSDKTGLIPFARALVSQGVALLSTGGTYQALQQENIPVQEVSAHTGFPEIMAGRVKTLHPTIHGGILARRGIDDDVLQTHDIAPIDLVVVNLYPFVETIAKPNCTLEDAIENIDIGGPTMVRAAAKNHAFVTVVVNPSDYDGIVAALASSQGLEHDMRFELAVKAFEHTAAYDAAIANYLGTLTQKGTSDFPQTLTLQFHQAEVLRYGENSHQAGAFYRDSYPPAGCIATSKQHQGKALSYNNIADADTALETVKLFEGAACVIVKHANPCGVAVADTIGQAYQRAFETDPESAFGGVIAFNQPLDEHTARAIMDQQFVEVIIAPSITDSALACLQKKPSLRVLSAGLWLSTQRESHLPVHHRIRGYGH